MNRHPLRPSRPAAGFTVVELTISLAVTVIVLLAVLQLFDFSSKISKVQTGVADMQQTQRVAHYELSKMVRMAGRGGLPAGNLPDGFSVAVRDNVAVNSTIGNPGGEKIVDGTDVLTVRGSFTNEPWVVATNSTPSAFSFPSPAPAHAVFTVGTLEVSSNMMGRDQPLTALIDADTTANPVGLLLVSAKNSNAYMMVELDPGTTFVHLPLPPPGQPTVLTVGFKWTGGTNTTRYQTFSSAGSGIVPDEFKDFLAGVPQTPEVGSVAIIEEYRYYVREEQEIPGDLTSELVRRLSRAQVYPGTSSVYKGDVANWTQDLADNVLDLQVALGVNTANGGCTIQNGGATNCTMFEAANGVSDDWLLNEFPAAATIIDADLRYLRFSTLVRTDKRDTTYQAPTIAKIENRDYTTLAPNTVTADRMFRRRVLQTVIDLRNL